MEVKPGFRNPERVSAPFPAIESIEVSLEKSLQKQMNIFLGPNFVSPNSCCPFNRSVPKEKFSTRCIVQYQYKVLEQPFSSFVSFVVNSTPPNPAPPKCKHTNKVNQIAPLRISWAQFGSSIMLISHSFVPFWDGTCFYELVLYV